MSLARILIVDDDRNIQRMLRICLEGCGYAVESAVDGVDALEKIEQMPPDVVLLDLAMPVLDGLGVLAEIQPLLRPHPLRVIVMTAHGSVRLALQAVRMGAEDFLEKPFRPEEVRRSVGNMLAEQPDGQQKFNGMLEAVREALRRGKFIAAEAGMFRAGLMSDYDPSFLNLAGVLHESHGRFANARDLYSKALVIDPSHAAARLNLKRLDQIEQHGATRLQAALGDEPLGDCEERLIDRRGEFLNPAPKKGRL